MPNLNNPMVPQELLVVGAALRVGIFDVLIEKPIRLVELAEKLSFDYRALWTVIEALKALGYVRETHEQIELTEEARDMFFNEESENYIGYSLIHTFNVIRSWTRIPEVLATGKQPERERSSQDIKGFMAAMNRNAKAFAPELITICLEELPERPSVLDLGGGPLNYAKPFAKAGARVTVQDIPEVCEIMQPQIEAGEEIRFAPGDFTQGVVEGQFDLAFLGNICHIYGPEENKLLFERVSKSLKPGGRIAILDIVRGVSPRAELFGVNMLVNTETGGTWTLEQYSQWLEDTGYANVKMIDTEGRQVIIATLAK